MEGVGKPVSKDDLAKLMEAAVPPSTEGGGEEGEAARHGPAPVFTRRLADVVHPRDLFATDESMNSVCVVLNDNQYHRNYGVALYSDYQPYIEYTGNQSQRGYSANLYFSVCLVVQQAVPEVGKTPRRVRRRVMGQQQRRSSRVASRT